MASPAYQRIITDTLKANGRGPAGLWQFECAVRRHKGRVDVGRLRAALDALEQTGRLERVALERGSVAWQMAAGRR